MPKKAWEFILDGEPHTVEMDYGWLSGKASVWLDGAPIGDRVQRLDFGDCGFACQFEVKGHICRALVGTNRNRLSYDLLVDGRLIEAKEANSPSVTRPAP